MQAKETQGAGRILFFAEAVTLAHVARSFTLASALDPARFRLCFAADQRYDQLLGDMPFSRRNITSITSKAFLGALARGAPVYDAKTLGAYVREDLRVIEEFSPDLVVGDFRLSLSVSARLAGVPYVSITNAYWSPYAKLRYVVPELPLTRILGARTAQVAFDCVRPLAFAWHSLAMNRVRKRFGLAPLGLDLRRIYTDADYVCYSDIPELVPTASLPATHRFIGPVFWSPKVPYPPWWNTLPESEPVIYLSLGSSGRGSLLPIIMEALAELPVVTIAATLGQPLPSPLPRNVFYADFLPGAEAVKKASAVICNGGSPTSYQALAAGVPVIGIANNLDQYLNMSLIEHTGAGKLMRAGETTITQVRQSVDAVLSRRGFKESAARLQRCIAACNATERFPSFLSEILQGNG